MSLSDRGLQLRHPLVRDLAWCIFSSPLVIAPPGVDGQPQAMAPGDAEYLQALDRQPGALVEWLKELQHTRLGLRFERFWQFWLLYRQPSLHIEQRFNVQIQAAGKTLGELDAVAYDAENGQLTHREMAVKFYLGIYSEQLPENIRPAATCCWVGANVSDRLDLKCRQLFTRQMHLLDREEARNCLPETWRWQSVCRRVIVRGRLFYPLNSELDDAVKAGLFPQHLHGQWLHLKQLPHLQDAMWMVLNRQQWFAEVCLPENDQCLGLPSLEAKLRGLFQRVKQPLQIARVELRDGFCKETERYFVVPDHWPLTAAPF